MRDPIRDRVNRWQVRHRHRLGDPSMVRVPVHTPSLARIPPPTAPLTTTATDTVGCHTCANFALVGGRRDLLTDLLADLLADLVADQIENNNNNHPQNKLKKLHKSYTKKRRKLHNRALDQVHS